MSLDEVLMHPWILQHMEKSVQSGLRCFKHMLEHAAAAG